MQKKQYLRLANLFLDLENPRFEKQSSQVEALNTMAREQGDKLIALLKDIIAHGLNPTDLPIVMPSSDKGFVVLEGNRRIACLKLLKKPSILNDKTLRSKYSKLHDSSKDKTPKSIECLIVDERKEAYLWIERKHEGEQGGMGTVPWNSEQKDRFIAIKTGKGSKTLQLIEFMKEAAGEDDEFKAQLKDVGNTNLERFLSTEYVRTKLGLILDKGEYYSRYPLSELMKGLRAVVKRLSSKEFKVADIYKAQDRVDYIDKFTPDELPDTTQKRDTQWSLKGYEKDNTANNKGTADTNQNQQGTNDSKQKGGEQNPQGGGAAGDQRPTTRETLIPQGLIFTIPNERINRMFVEMKSLDLNDTPNICAVMMRVFVEWSMDCFIETYNLKNEKQMNPNYRRSIREKFSDVLEKLKTLHVVHPDYYKGMETAFSEEASSIFSFHTLNAYVHNNSFNPIPSELMLSWDNAQPFIEALWKAVNEKQNKNKEK